MMKSTLDSDKVALLRNGRTDLVWLETFVSAAVKFAKGEDAKAKSKEKLKGGKAPVTDIRKKINKNTLDWLSCQCQIHKTTEDPGRNFTCSLAMVKTAVQCVCDLWNGKSTADQECAKTTKMPMPVWDFENGDFLVEGVDDFDSVDTDGEKWKRGKDKVLKDDTDAECESRQNEVSCRVDSPSNLLEDIVCGAESERLKSLELLQKQHEQKLKDNERKQKEKYATAGMNFTSISREERRKERQRTKEEKKEGKERSVGRSWNVVQQSTKESTEYKRGKEMSMGRSWSVVQQSSKNYRSQNSFPNPYKAVPSFLSNGNYGFGTRNNNKSSFEMKCGNKWRRNSGSSDNVPYGWSRIIAEGLGAKKSVNLCGNHLLDTHKEEEKNCPKSTNSYDANTIISKNNSFRACSKWTSMPPLGHRGLGSGWEFCHLSRYQIVAYFLSWHKKDVQDVVSHLCSLYQE